MDYQIQFLVDFLMLDNGKGDINAEYQWLHDRTLRYI